MTVSNNMQQFLKKQFTRLNNICRIAVDWLQTRSPRSVVWFAFSLLILYTVAALVINPVFFRDSSEYVALVEAFRLGAYERAFPAHLPVLYTVFAGLIAKTGLLSSVSSLLLVSGVATALSVFPVYGILKRCVPSRWASWGTLLWALIPQIIEYGIAPLIDSGRYLFIALALYLILNEKAEYRFLRFMFLGIVYGCLILVRAEGILFVGILCFIHTIKLISDTCSAGMLYKIIKTVVTMVLILLTAIAVVVPRMMQMYRQTGYPIIDSRQSNAMNSFLNELGWVKKKSVDNTVVSYETHGGSGTATLNVSKLLNQSRYVKNVVQGFSYLYLPFTILGLIIFVRRRKINRTILLLLTVLVLYCLVHFFLRAGASRYLSINAMFSMPLTLIGLNAVYKAIQKYFVNYYSFLFVLLLVWFFVTVAYSTKIFNDNKYRAFKNIGKHLVGSMLRNPGISRPVVLLIGSDRGLGYYSGVNVVWYSKLGLDKIKSIDDIIRDGVSSEYVYYWTVREIPPIVHIDAVVVDAKNEGNKIELYRQLFELPINEGRLQLLKVKY